MNIFPKLLHRSFIISFLLPSLLFFGYSEYFVTFDANLIDIFDERHLLRYSLSSIMLSIFLTVLNRPIIRFLEGYGRFNPFLVLLPHVKSKFKTEIEPLYVEARRVEAARQQDATAEPDIPNFSTRLRLAVESYPDRADLLLPTRFGNVYRAAEVYSRVIYGLDAIPAWPRLQMLLPTRVRDQLRDARSGLDFTVNILALAIVAIIILSVQSFNRTPPKLIFWIIPIFIAIYAWLMLPSTVHQWADAIRSVVDLYRSRLAQGLGVQLPINAEDERNLWREVSSMMIYRTASPLTSIQKLRVLPKTPKR